MYKIYGYEGKINFKKEKSLLLGIKVDMTCKLLKEKKKQGQVYNQFLKIRNCSWRINLGS